METNRATEDMAQGCVCSESVLLAVCPEFEVDVDDRIIRGRNGKQWGCTGAIMGIVTDREQTMEEALITLPRAQELRRRFEAEMKTINCREPTGADLTTEEGIKKSMSSNTPRPFVSPQSPPPTGACS